MLKVVSSRKRGVWSKELWEKELVLKVTYASLIICERSAGNQRVYDFVFYGNTNFLMDGLYDVCTPMANTCVNLLFYPFRKCNLLISVYLCTVLPFAI